MIALKANVCALLFIINDVFVCEENDVRNKFLNYKIVEQ